MPSIYNSILQTLKECETNYNVKIPLAIESGSRSWGFASPDSDYDCRFIYVHQQDWYISILEQKDVIEYAADEIFDINGWDLKKAIQHIIKSNAVIFEWLTSDIIYSKDQAITQELQALAAKFFNPIAVSYHYLCIAKNKFAEILTAEQAKLKQYFYVLRPLANVSYIRQYGKMPYMEYDKTLEAVKLAPTILAEINRLKDIKATARENYKIPQNNMLMNYFNSEISLYEAYLKTMKFDRNKDYHQADAVFRKIIEMAWKNA